MILFWNFLSLNFKWFGLVGLIGVELILKYGGSVLWGGFFLLVLLFLFWMEKFVLDWFLIVCFYGGVGLLKDFCLNVVFVDVMDMIFFFECCLLFWYGNEFICFFDGGIVFCLNLFLNEVIDDGFVLEGVMLFWFEDGFKGVFGGGVFFKVCLICWRLVKDSFIFLVFLCE